MAEEVKVKRTRKPRVKKVAEIVKEVEKIEEIIEIEVPEIYGFEEIETPIEIKEKPKNIYAKKNITVRKPQIEEINGKIKVVFK